MEEHVIDTVTSPPASVLHGGRIHEAAREWGCDWRDVLDFSANINPLGPAPAVREALIESIGRIAHYPENGSPRLRAAVARAWKVAPENVIAGNGATELLYFLVRVLQPRRVHLVAPTFSEYFRAAVGCVVTQTALSPEECSIDWLRLTAEVADARPDWLVITHPNNPTGAVLDPQRFLRWFDHERAPETVVVIDESFIDFAPELSIVSGAVKRRNLLVLRSLTKFHALPGLRIGCLVCDAERVAELERVREPWQVNVLAEQAALAALADMLHQRHTIEFVASERRWLHQRLDRLRGVRTLPSHANFLFSRCDRPVTELERFLARRRILIRNCSDMPGAAGEAFRVAVRKRPENEMLVAALEDFFGD
jgi:threonine-phosphate decarboxylase